MSVHLLAEQAPQILAIGPGFMDPEFWLSGTGPFGNAILPALLAVDFIESGLLFPFLPGDTLLFDADAPHGPVDLVALPARYLSIISYPQSR